MINLYFLFVAAPPYLVCVKYRAFTCILSFFLCGREWKGVEGRVGLIISPLHRPVCVVKTVIGLKMHD